MRGLIGAIVGGIIGAAIWAALIYSMKMQMELIAWGIGGLVGLASFMAGGKGLQNGIICVAVTALAIFGGKMLAAKSLASKALAESDQAAIYDSIVLLQDAYKENVNSSNDHKEFIARQGLFGTENLQQVTADHLSTFEEQYVPALEGQSFHEWAGLNTKGVVGAGFNTRGIVFVILGLLTAFRCGRGSAVGAL